MQSLSVPLLPQKAHASPHKECATSGEFRFVADDEMAVRCESAAKNGSLVVLVTCDSSTRTRLSEKIDARIEIELAARGASAPGMGSEIDPDALLSDQLFRSRKLGHESLCLCVSGLGRLGDGIDAVDAKALQFFAKATRDRPVILWLRESDRSLIAFAAPIPLDQFLSPASPEAKTFESVCDAETDESDEEDNDDGPPLISAALIQDVEIPAKPTGVAEVKPDTRVTRQHASADYKPWVTSLTSARGPQPLATFEKLFAQSYMPLTNAIAGGVRDPKAMAAQDEFHRTFARAYTDACPTFALTGKRPKMVLDAHEVAKKFARIHGARQAHLVLVDAMRWDIGTMIRDELTSQLTGLASFAGEITLFSALPTVTSRQLEGLSRGIDSLRFPHDPERETDPVRGRTAEMIRRIKVGTRDVFKLDSVEAGLARAESHALELLPELAQAAADSIAKHAKTLPARTLLFVFGDHGFWIDEDGATHQGGASPEEVILPAFAYLTGELH